MIQFLYKWLLWKRQYIIEINMFRNSLRKFCDLLLLPYAFPLFGFWMRKQMHNSIVSQSYSHSCTTRFDVMFLSIPYYKTKVIIILVFWCNRRFYRYGSHIELIRFKEHYRMLRGHERISFVFSSAFRDIFS